ncbi:TetR/AcrR family transcriptional regulator [Mycobacterium sp. CVI_P3]|uniref:TetR/AcrR family transcriptional regulator n=1 Tax=Mycobacterium pinniadriaticum TaxID=2994102 RepID=A0ABT3SB51_9MYCO|nr:TetR/AcrR family transcriptional regulator [Mycobacterium pinniadriaticum]MCX2930008.1 TetR/AcrR family transcriptional regulator [Mycobacterium pinniadriaticum]MCX2936343.1 TetR/AcrR family transcriptional regulator [Mycobacterium pinniadriaticum]
MDPAPPRPLQLSHSQRRGMLSRHFVGVVEKLVEGGASYADLSVEAIITAGGISRSTFYVYFDDKGDLLVAMAADVIGDLVSTGSSWWDLPPDATRADLHAALRIPIDTYRQHRTILSTVVETAAYDPRVREQHQSLIGQVVPALAGYIAGAQTSGTADPDLDAERTARWLVWMIERGLYQLVGTADDDEVDSELDALTDIVWRVVYRRTQ